MREQVGDGPADTVIALDGEADGRRLHDRRRRGRCAAWPRSAPATPSRASCSATRSSRGARSSWAPTSDHLSFTLRTPTGAIRVVAFRRADAHDLVASGAPLDVVVTPTVNEWKGYRTPELHGVGDRRLGAGFAA